MQVDNVNSYGPSDIIVAARKNNNLLIIMQISIQIIRHCTVYTITAMLTFVKRFKSSGLIKQRYILFFIAV